MPSEQLIPKVELPKLTKQQIIEQLWRRGDITWKMHSIQKDMYKVFMAAPENSKLVWLLGRQSGKTWELVMLAIMQALKKSNSIIKFLTKTKLNARSIVEPIFNELLKDCPEDLQPSYNSQQYVYSFPNGSKIQLAGSDGGHADKLRGHRSELVLVDEAGFCDDLQSIVTSILIPTTIHTGGKIVLASTPSPNPEHEFYDFIEEAELHGFLTKKTILDNPMLTKEQIETFIKQMGGITHPLVRRELFCEIVRDEESVIIPEMTDAHCKDVIREWPKPPFYDPYVSMDLGFHDLTVVLFGYFDYRSGKVIIEDEIAMKGEDIKLPELADAILKKETLLWTDPMTAELKKPTRYSDINYLVTQEMARHTGYKLTFATPKKDDLRAAVSALRLHVAGGNVIIHPRCQTLIRHLKHLKWRDKKEKGGFARSPDDGHYDAAAALIYMLRMINFNKNPYPNHYNLNIRSGDLYVNNPDQFNSGDTKHLYAKIFGRNRQKH